MDSETTAEINPTELVVGWKAMSTRRPNLHAEVVWAGRTDIGRVRENNEDKFDFFLPEDGPSLALRGRLWAVADGMGGHNAGQVASEAALKTVIRTYFSTTSESVVEALRAALNEANDLIVRASRHVESKSGMGTTAVIAVLLEDTLTLAHVGDSRAYLLRANEPIRQLTTDHSWVEEQVRRGTMSREEAEASPYRNVITRSIGMGEGLAPDFVTIKVYPNDRVLLATDGMTTYLDEEKITSVVGSKSPSRAVLDLIDAANDAGGRDNITALLLTIRDIRPYDAPPVIVIGGPTPRNHPDVEV